MTNEEAINWIINISADIGKAEHRDLWHYEQALSEIREMLETAQTENLFEIGKPHLLKGYKFKMWKDVCGEDWVEICKHRQFDELLKG